VIDIIRLKKRLPLIRYTRQLARHTIYPDMNIVHKVNWVADTGKATPRVDSVSPIVQLVVVLEREEEPLLVARL